MGGKSNRGRNRKGLQDAANHSEQPNAPLSNHSDANGIPAAAATEPSNASSEVKELENISARTIEQGDLNLIANDQPKQNENNATEESKAKQGDVHLFPVTVKSQGGEKLELQLSPGDSVMDVRQFLLDAPETCFFTCYDLLLHTEDGAIHQLEDYNEISEVADITVGDCYLEMVAALYDDRSIRAHVHRTRELLSLSTLHSSLSTSLALQHQTGQTISGTSGDLMKSDVAELEHPSFMDNVSGSLSNLFLPPSKEIQCAEAIVFSSFNPPPSYRRLSGDLIYLDVATLEGNKYCITGTTKNFYINASTGTILDPRPSKSAFEAATIVGLLQKISSKFKKAFREILERKASSHPFENVQSLLPPNSWLGSYPIPDHKRDAARAEDALTLSFGSELSGMQRDWNEELQSCREFPHSTAQERILRDRALYKVTSDFVDAALNGAIGVISRCIPPINPTDPECFHMYVHNNIFFSFAVDADLEQLPRKHSSDAPKIESSVTHISSSERTSSNVPHGNNIADKADSCNMEAVNGIVDTISDVPAETQLAESEQATYASANNDLKGTKAYQEADVPGLYNLAMAIIDYRGHRVVAQSVLPGILQGDKSESLLYGSVDNGKKICWSEGFHSKVSEAAKHLHLKEHSVLDGSGNIFKLAAPVECKGIVGSDDRHYLLDLLRVTPRDANYTGPGSRFCILRPELITAFCHAEATEKSKSLDKSEGLVSGAPNSSSNVHSAEAVANVLEKSVPGLEMQQDDKVETDALEGSDRHSDSKDIRDEILFNPNVFTEFQLAGPPEEIAADEENVRKASGYLKDVILPKFVQDLCTLEVSPMDGHTLTEALHANGINVRYLGKVAEGTRHMPHLWDLCLNEIVMRSAKHILKNILRDSEDHDLGNAVAHFLNCLFGNNVNRTTTNSMSSGSQKKDHIGNPASWKPLKSQAKSKNRGSSRKKQSSFLSISSDSLWSDIQEFAKLKYQFELLEDARLHVKKIPVIRNLAQKVGITVASRRYDLDAVSPFQTSDILNLQPVVKHAVPVSSEAKDLVETGKVQLAEQNLSEAYTLFSEAFTILQQVTGPMHREVANCCRYLAMVLYHAGDMPGAIMQQHKELIINERCLGLDHPDTAHSYGNMALFYHGLSQTDLALRHMSRALLLLSLSSGPDHPDVAATFINVAMMYQDIGKMDTALRYLQEALKKNQRLLGEEHIQTAVCYHALAIAFNCMGAIKLSITHESKTLDILVKQLGKEDSRTKDSEHWLNTFKKREEKMAAQKQQGQKAVDMLKAQLIHSGAGTSVSLNKSLNAVAPRGRGVDERAAKATAEVRKKAAARGLLTCQPGVPVTAIPQYSPQLANRNNLGRNPGVANNNGEHTGKKEVNGHPPSVAGTAPVHNPKPSPEQDKRPVGLGAGLKQRTKDKAMS